MHDGQGVSGAPGLRLVSVYTCPFRYDILLQLLEEREPHESISHRAMPSESEHRAFVDSRPYASWYLAVVDDRPPSSSVVGAVYLTRQNEIGIGIFKRHRSRGYAEQAIGLLMQQHPGERLLANINPHNAASVHLFRKLGFDGPIQHTYERRA